MGKAKRSKLLRKEAFRQNPVGICSVRSLERWEEETACQKSTETAYVQNIIEQVESRLAEERNNGLNALAVAADNGDILQELLGTDIISTAANILLDDSVMVRHSAAGALRNLSGVSGSVCEILVNRNVMKSLVNLFKQKYAADWSPSKGKVLADGSFKSDSATEAFIQALHLMSNLCAASEQALQIFNAEKLFQMLPRTLDVATFGLPAAIAGARCLLTVTEENRDNIPNIAELLPILFTILSDSEDRGADFTYFQALVTGTAYNLLDSGNGQGQEGGNMLPVLHSLGRILTNDEVEEIKRFSSDVPLEEEGMDTGKGAAERERSNDLTPEQRSKLESSASRILRILEAEKLAMEILSNLVFVEDEDGTEFMNDSEADDEPMEEDCVMDKPSLPVAGGDYSVQISDGVRNAELVTKVMSKVKGLPVNVAEILENNFEYGTDIIEKLGNMRSVAILCLQNLLQAFDLDTLGGAEKLNEIYTTLMKILPSIASAQNDKKSGSRDFLEAVISGLRAVLQRAIDENCERAVESFSTQELEGLASLYSETDNCRMASNVVRLVGSFGFLISRRQVSPESKSLMLKTGEFLLSCLSFGNEKDDLVLTAEALDTIFDVFAEDDFNDVLKELTLLDKLRHLAPHFKKQIRNRRRGLGESRGVVETARTNLSRFIDYKKGVGC